MSPPVESIRVIVSQTGNELFFDLPAAKKPDRTVLLDIVLRRLGGEDAGNELFWDIKMNIFKFSDEPVIAWPLRYGTPILNTEQIAAPKKLRPGRYVFYAGVNFADGRPSIEAFKILRAKFSIDERFRVWPEEDN
jgi:hypothetical protein